MTEQATIEAGSIDGAASALDDGLGAAACRAAFVAMIKDENFYREPGCKVSLKAHWTGANGGFSDEWLQKRWHDFQAGWAAKPAAPNDRVEGRAAASSRRVPSHDGL